MVSQNIGVILQIHFQLLQQGHIQNLPHIYFWLFFDEHFLLQLTPLILFYHNSQKELFFFNPLHINLFSNLFTQFYCSQVLHVTHQNIKTVQPISLIIYSKYCFFFIVSYFIVRHYQKQSYHPYFYQRAVHMFLQEDVGFLTNSILFSLNPHQNFFQHSLNSCLIFFQHAIQIISASTHYTVPQPIPGFYLCYNKIPQTSGLNK